MAKTDKKKQVISPVKIGCSRCKERKSPGEFRSFNDPLPTPTKNKSSHPIALCAACRRILAKKKSQKHHNRKPKNRLSLNIQTGIYKSLRTGKPGLWESRVGYTLAELRDHLQSQFTAGMSWSNYGQWQIDHVRPVAFFDFESYEDEDFKRCWALSNLRPLWAKDNWARSKTRQPMRKCFDESPYASCLDCPQTVHIKYRGRFCQRFRRWVPEWWEARPKLSSGDHPG